MEYILSNKLGIKDNYSLNKAERRYSAIRAIELRQKSFKKFSFDTLKKMHKEIFQDVYDWAGKTRNVNIAKGKTFFCPMENINSFANDIFNKLEKQNYLKGLNQDEFCQKAAELFGDINALHPFREGNGRTQREFIYHLAKNAGYELDLNKTDKNKYMVASIESMLTSNKKMVDLMKSVIKPLEKTRTISKRKLSIDTMNKGKNNELSR